MWILLIIIVLLICEGLYLASRLMTVTEELHKARKELYTAEELHITMRHNLQVVMDAHAKLARDHAPDDPYRYEREHQTKHSHTPKHQEGTNGQSL